MSAQSMQALALANRTRLTRLRICREILNGETTVADVLADFSVELQGMPLDQLLRAQHRWAKIRTRRLLTRCGIRENKPIGELTERQRRAVIEALS